MYLLLYISQPLVPSMIALNIGILRDLIPKPLGMIQGTPIGSTL